MISIIIPVKNGGNTISRCLRAVCAQTRPAAEVILVDDGCTDDTLEQARAFPIHVIANNKTGVAAARNTGAHAAKGDILLFLDVDVILPPDALERMRRAIKEQRVSGLVALESLDIPSNAFATRYKNLWMHYTFSRLPEYIHSFYTCAAAIRKRDFLANHGFDENYRRPNVEDTAFGRKLANNGYLIKVLKHLEILHLKEYTLASLVKTDFLRSAGLLKIVLREKWQNFQRRNQSSVPLGFILSVFFPALAVLCLALSPLKPLCLWPAGILLICFYLFNLRFLLFVKARQGSGFFLLSALFILLDSLVVLAGLVYGFITFIFSGRRY